MVDNLSRRDVVQHQRPPLWRDIRILQLAGQFIFALIVVVVAWQLINNVLNALAILGQAPDFRFWMPENFFQGPARFSFTEGPGLTSTDTFGRAFAVGIINTLRAVVVGILLSTLLGIVIGVARLSRNWLVRSIAGVYVEIFQNTPLLVQLIFIYRGVFLTLPQIQDAVTFPGSDFRDALLRLVLYVGATVIGVGALWYLRSLLQVQQKHSDTDGSSIRGRIITTLIVIGIVAIILFALPDSIIYLSSRGLVIPAILPTATSATWLAFVGLAVLAASFIWYVRSELERRTGQPSKRTQYAVLTFLVVTLIGWLVIGEAPFVFDIPIPQIAELSDGRQVIRRINGGETISPEYAALMTGLTLYTAAFIGEIVRAGIQAISYGQIEAASAVGLNRTQTLQLIILPQALRIIIPPLGNQYLNLTKNSSLATAIGFLDVFAVTKTIIHQSGQDVVMIIAVMITYLIASLTISAGMNWLNGRMRLKER